jgi:hypothetical protein
MKPVTWIKSLGLLLLACSTVIAEVRDEIAFPDVDGYRTLKCDFHMHTVFSDGQVWPTVRVDEAYREGLDAIAITDHIEYQPHAADIPTNHNRPYEIAKDLAARRNIILIRGTEITRDTPPGHFNAIFLKDVDPLDTPEFYDVFEAAAEQGAFVFWNHPGWQGREKGKWGEWQQTLYERKWLHGIEICNGNVWYDDGTTYAFDKNLICIGTSDVHPPMPTKAWTPEEHRTLTLVFAREKTYESLKEAVFAGRTAVWWKNQVIGYEPQLRQLFNACVEIEPAHVVNDRSQWVEIRNHSELDITLTRSGKVGRSSIVLPARKTTLVHMPVTPEQAAAGLAYRATNFKTGLKSMLEVNLRIPARAEVPTTQPVASAAD